VAALYIAYQCGCQETRETHGAFPARCPMHEKPVERMLAGSAVAIEMTHGPGRVTGAFYPKIDGMKTNL